MKETTKTKIWWLVIFSIYFFFIIPAISNDMLIKMIGLGIIYLILKDEINKKIEEGKDVDILRKEGEEAFRVDLDKEFMKISQRGEFPTSNKDK